MSIFLSGEPNATERGTGIEAEQANSAQDNQGAVLSQRPFILGIQGGQGSFNEAAARFFIQDRNQSHMQVKYLYTSENVVAATARGEIDRGQCAIYNSAGGWVEETTEALKNHPVKIIEEFEIRIAHAIMRRSDQDFSTVTTLMGHPQVFAQCSHNLAKKYPNLKQVSGEGDLIDNARIAEALANGELPAGVAVMGSRILSEIYGLVVVADNLQDLNDNLTRFVHVVRAD
jgi:prephenate dehydratase